MKFARNLDLARLNHAAVRRAARLVCVLALATLAACEREQPSSGVLIIESTPEPGADIIISGDGYGVTPATIRNLPAGKYYAILSLYGYRRANATLNMPPEGEVRVTVPMERIVGYLTLETEPPGAQIYLNTGEYLGTSPLIKAAVPEGEYTYEIRHANFDTAYGNIEVRADYTYSRNHRLQALAGWLQIFSRPTGSQIYIDDVLQEEVTPASFKLSPGVYTIGTYQEGFLMAEKNVTVASNAQQSIDLTMEEGYMPRGMVLVPEGDFIMGVDGGSPDERPRRKVHLPAFYIDKFEVTNMDFKKVFPSHTYEERTGMQPVVGVTWEQASAYAQAVGKRLPTEEEWEKAARGVDGREYPWGNAFDPNVVNISTGPRSTPTRVGKFRPGASPYGAMDMAGNAYEWTSSWYQPYAGNEAVKDAYGQIFRVLRGGAYTSDRFGVRVARRHYDKPDNARSDYGFRCALDAVPAAGAGPAPRSGAQR